MRKVSIIVPAYNVEKFIKNTIKSIEAQTYIEKEIIIVDDGSTDNTLEICKKMAEKDNQIKVIHQNNKGVSEARNKGIDISTGEYIIFIDSDDLMEKDMIEILVNGLESKNADISICGYKIKNNKDCYSYYDTECIEEYDRNKMIEEFLKEEKIAVSLWNKLFRRECIDNIRFDKNLRINEDKLFLLKVICNANIAIYQDYCKYMYIKRKNSATTGFSSKMFDVMIVNKKIKMILKAINYKNITMIEINEVINLIVLYRMLLLSNSKKIYIKEYNNIRTMIKKSIIPISDLFKINKTKAIELYMIKYFEYIYKFSIIIGKKIKIIKKLKNWRQKNEIRNSNIS